MTMMTLDSQLLTLKLSQAATAYDHAIQEGCQDQSSAFEVTQEVAAALAHFSQTPTDRVFAATYFNAALKSVSSPPATTLEEMAQCMTVSNSHHWIGLRDFCISLRTALCEWRAHMLTIYTARPHTA